MTIDLSSMRVSCLLISIVLVASFQIVACSEKEKPKRAIAPEMNIDAALSEISQMAAFIQFNMKVQKTMSCLTSSSMDTTDLINKNLDRQELKTDVYVNNIISEMMDSYKNLCKFFIEVEKTTAPTFEKIKREGSLPNELYVFSFFSETNDVNEDGTLFEEQEVGLFDTLVTCEVIERFAHDKNIPVRQCRKWEDIVKLLNKPNT